MHPENRMQALPRLRRLDRSSQEPGGLIARRTLLSSAAAVDRATAWARWLEADLRGELAQVRSRPQRPAVLVQLGVPLLARQ
jgi:hypothetical protein